MCGRIKFSPLQLPHLLSSYWRRGTRSQQRFCCFFFVGLALERLPSRRRPHSRIEHHEGRSCYSCSTGVTVRLKRGPPPSSAGRIRTGSRCRNSSRAHFLWFFHAVSTMQNNSPPQLLMLQQQHQQQHQHEEQERGQPLAAAFAAAVEEALIQESPQAAKWLREPLGLNGKSCGTPHICLHISSSPVHRFLGTTVPANNSSSS